MADALFLFDSRIDDPDNVTVAVSLGTEISTLPIENVQSTDRNLVSRITLPPANVVRIDITLTGNRSLDTLGLVDCNITSGGTYRLRGWTDALRGSSLVFDTGDTPPPIPNPDTYTASVYGSGNYGLGSYGYGSALPDEIDRNVYLEDLGETYSARYFELRIIDANLTFLQLSRIYLSLRKQYGVNVAYNLVYSRESRSRTREAIGGARFRRLLPQRRGMDVSYEFNTDAESDELQLNLQQFGEDIPFIFCAQPFVNDVRTSASSIYGVYQGPTTSPRFLDINSFTFRLSEEL